MKIVKKNGETIRGFCHIKYKGFEIILNNEESPFGNISVFKDGKFMKQDIKNIGAAVKYIKREKLK